MVSSHGRFVWYELMTTDMEAAKAFYANVVGWGTRDASTPGLAYTLFTVGDSPVTGLMDLPEDARRTGVTPHGWDMSASTTWTPPSTGSSSLAERCTSHRRTSPTSAAFRSSPTRKWQRLRWSRGRIPAGRSPPSSAHRGAWAGMSCLPPTGRRRSLSTASYLAGKKRTPIPARWARISSSPPEGRRSAACSPSLRRCRFPSGFTISTPTTSRRRRSAWRLAGAKSCMARLQCRAAPGSSIAPTLRAPYSRCWIGAAAKLSDISSASRDPRREPRSDKRRIRYRRRRIAIWPLPARPCDCQSEASDFAPRPIAN